MINYTWWMFGVCSMNAPYPHATFHSKSALVLPYTNFFLFSSPFVVCFGRFTFCVCVCVCSFNICCMTFVSSELWMRIYAPKYSRTKTQFIIFRTVFSLACIRLHFRNTFKANTQLDTRARERMRRTTNMHTRLKCEYGCRPSNSEAHIEIESFWWMLDEIYVSSFLWIWQIVEAPHSCVVILSAIITFYHRMFCSVRILHILLNGDSFDYGPFQKIYSKLF